MPGRVVLDTSAAVDFLGRRQGVNRLLEAADEVCVPTIALGELFYGALKSAQVEAGLAQVESLASGTTVLDCDIETAGSSARSGTI